MVQRVVIPLSNKAYFCFKVHTVVSLDGLLYVVDEANHVISGGIAHIHDKAGMLGADLGAAHGVGLLQ